MDKVYSIKLPNHLTRQKNNLLSKLGIIKLLFYTKKNCKIKQVQIFIGTVQIRLEFRVAKYPSPIFSFSFNITRTFFLKPRPSERDCALAISRKD